MREIDLIPDAYRVAKRARRWWFRLGALHVLGLVMTAGAWWHFNGLVKETRQDLETLRMEKNSVIATRNRIDALLSKRDELNRQLLVLDRLRGGPRVQSVFYLVDQALIPELWFTEWRFLRAGEQIVEKTNERHAGFIVLADRSAGNNNSKSWRMSTHMEIRARATSHEALATFVGRLARKPIVEDVRVLSTRRQASAQQHAIESELAIVIKDREQGT